MRAREARTGVCLGLLFSSRNDQLSAKLPNKFYFSAAHELEVVVDLPLGHADPDSASFTFFSFRSDQLSIAILSLSSTAVFTDLVLFLPKYRELRAAFFTHSLPLHDLLLLDLGVSSGK